jgi:hypothetical protein
VQSEPASGNRQAETRPTPSLSNQTEEPQPVANRNQQTAQAINTNKTLPQPDSSKPPAIASLILTPGAVRGSGETNRLLIPAGKRAAVELNLELLEDDYRSYRAELLTAEGERVAGLDALKPKPVGAGGRRVTLNFPARLLAPGDYQVRLRGVNSSGQTEDVGRYYFRALNK